MSSFSIWLLLEKESRSNYRQIVKTISKRLKAPNFEPHCTIYGHLNTDIEILKPFVTELAKNYNQFSASVKKIKSGDSYSKSLYVSIKNSGALNQLNTICKNKFNFKTSFSTIAQFIGFVFGVFLIAYCTNLYFLNWTVALVFFVLLSFTFALSIRMIPMRRMIQVIKYE